MKLHFHDDKSNFLIRPVEIADAEIIHTHVLNSISQLLTFMAWAHFPQSVEAQEERIAKAQNEYLVFDMETKEFLMSTGYHRSKTLNPKALEIGYWTTTKQTNQGLATKATKILIILAFEQFQSDCVVIGCNQENIPSQRVIEKCGFKSEGVLRNYFEEPTKKMIEQGHTTNRNFLYYSLIPEDLSSLQWYKEYKSYISIL